MSRCYPYIPHGGYALGRSSEEGLIKSIKLRINKEKTKDEKKGKRRDKKENEEKRKAKCHKNSDKSAVVHVPNHRMPLFDEKCEFFPKAKEVENELLERSSLTEEHGPPAFLAPSTSSDSTENSIKRKRQSSPVDVNRTRNIIRLKIQRKEQIKSNSPEQIEQPCSITRRVDVPHHNEKDTCITYSRENICSTSDIDREQVPSISRFNEAIAPVKLETPSVQKLPLTAVQREQLLYKNLIENWHPPTMLQDSYIEEDLDWLFSGKRQSESSLNKQRCGNDSILCSSIGLQPRAQYLPEIKIYALPFTIPF